jgi:holo-[acyl-carrier protein] synthase
MATSSIPLRVGLDLTSVKAVSESIRTHGRRYLERVYTPGELQECDTASGPDAERLAGRFAAKEATMKVLRPGDDTPLPWTAIEVHRAPGGSVEVELSGQAAELASASRVGSLSASITHEREFAAAVVVATTGPTAAERDG